MANLFDRLSKNRPTRITKKPEPSDAQKLLDWLQRWPKDTITTHEICVYGPNCIRDRKRALDAAERLARNGWLIPSGVRRYRGRDSYEWRIVRRSVLDPNITTDSPRILNEPAL